MGENYEGKVSVAPGADGSGASLHKPGSSPFAASSDVDLFLVGLTPEQALEKVKHIYKVMRLNRHGAKILVVKTGSALTFVAGGYPQRFIQVVLKLFASPTDVLTAFDVDCCGFCYDGTTVKCTHRALRAVATR